MDDIALGPLGTLPEPVPTNDSAGASPAPARRSAEQAERLVLELIAEHADSLLRVARRYSLCADDAQDAYQRTLELLMRHAHRLDAERAGGWLHTVVKREAVAVNTSRRKLVGGDDLDLDTIEVRTAPSPEDRVLAFERVSRSAEALQRLKPQEVRALWLKAMGNSYQEICETTGWTYTKVNRCLAEGRKSFLARYAGIEAGEECERWGPSLSAMVDGEATAEQLLELRPHLRNCGACRATVRELRGSSAPLVAIFPSGGAALGGSGPLDAAGQAIARLWELVWSAVNEKAAATAYRANSFVDAVTTGKMAATAASVAAIAGGGIAVEEAVVGSPEPPRAVLSTDAPGPSVTQVARSSGREPAAPRSSRRRSSVKRRPVVRVPARKLRPASRTATVKPTTTTTRIPAYVAAPTGAIATTKAPAPRPAAPVGSGRSGEFEVERP